MEARRMMNFKRFSRAFRFLNDGGMARGGVILAAICFAWVSAANLKAADVPPARVLLVTGGGWHDYEAQEEILTEGLRERIHIEWVVDHEGGTDADAKLSRFEDPDWADGFDGVVYNLCYSGVTDTDYIHRITEAHEQGLPAVVIHCAMHTFRDADTDQWRQLLGVWSNRHEGHRPYEVENLESEHPIMKPFPGSWETPKGELYMIEKLGGHTRPLAQAYGQDTDEDHVCVWINHFGEARVFGTTIGHHNETMETETYLDLVSRGLLWSLDGLQESGKPKETFAAREAKENGWVSLFDGKSLEDWKASENPDSFQVKDGVIVVDGPRGHLFYDGPVADADFEDFKFEADVYTFPNANSGMYFHTEYQEDGWPSEGVEAQVNATHSDRVKTGSVYGIENLLDDAPHQDHEWFRYQVVVQDNKVVLRVNGQKVQEYIEPENPEGGARLSSGTFALQAHDPDSRILYRNIRVKPLN